MNSGDNRPPALAYADHRTDAERAFRSLDRAMTGRLARVLGISLILFGVIVTFLLCAGMSNSTNQNLAIFVPLIVLCMFASPGLVLSVASNAVDRGGRAARIVVLVTSLFVFAMLSFGIAGSVWQLLRSRSPDGEYVQIFAFSLLIVGTAKLLYHTIRLIHYSDFQGEGADAIRDFWDLSRFRGQLGDRRQRRAISAMAITRIIAGTAAIIAGIYCAASAVPDNANAGRGSTTMAGFVARDLFDSDGLPLPERNAAIRGLDRRGWMTTSEREEVDIALRQYGAKILEDIPRPVTSERIAAAIENGTSSGVVSIGRDAHFRFSANGLDFWGSNGMGRVDGNICTVNGVRYWSLAFVEANLSRISGLQNGPLTQRQAENFLGLYQGDHGKNKFPLAPDSGARFLEDGTLNLYRVRSSDDRDKRAASNPDASDQVLITRTGEVIEQPIAKPTGGDSKLHGQRAMLGESSAVIVLAGLIVAMGVTSMLRLHKKMTVKSRWPSVSRRLSMALIAVTLVCLLGHLRKQINDFHISTGSTGAILCAAMASGVLILSELAVPVVSSKASIPASPQKVVPVIQNSAGEALVDPFGTTHNGSESNSTSI